MPAGFALDRAARQEGDKQAHIRRVSIAFYEGAALPVDLACEHLSPPQIGNALDLERPYRLPRHQEPNREM